MSQTANTEKRRTDSSSRVQESRIVKSIHIVLYDGVQLLDAAGPAEVFSQANVFCGHEYYDLRYVGIAASGFVRSSAGLNLMCEPLPQEPAFMLLVPGAEKSALAVALANNELMSWLAAMAGRVEINASVCTGAFFYGQLGLLDGREVTTHWHGIEELRQNFPKAKVLVDTLYVQDRDLWTSAGVLSGVDMALAMVRGDLGSSIALQVARALVVFLFRDGGQSQFSGPMDLQLKADRAGMLQLVSWLESELHNAITVERMAEQIAMSVRTLHRRCQLALGMTPAQLLSELRLERSRNLLSELAIPVKSIAVECGFSNPAAYSKAFARRFGIAPAKYRMRFSEGRGESIQP